MGRLEPTIMLKLCWMGNIVRTGEMQAASKGGRGVLFLWLEACCDQLFKKVVDGGFNLSIIRPTSGAVGT